MVAIEQTHRAKLRALAQGVRVWALEPGKRYCVPSCTNDGSAYEVVIQSNEPGDITCTCPAGTHRGICKHIGAVMVRLDVEQGVPTACEAQSAPERTLEDKLADLYPARSTT